MKHTFPAWSAIALTIAFILTSCSEDTGSLGVYPMQDAISTDTASFGILSSSVANDIVPANSTACFLGKVIDPEIDKAITATFATQFHIFENYSFPDEAHIVKTDDARQVKDNGHLCDSIEIRLFIKSTFGDKNNPMKIEVWPLSSDDSKLLKESTTLYSNTDLEQFADMSNGPLATKVITATDYIMSNAQRASSNYSRNVRIVLPREFGDNIMQKYYANPDNFRDSYSFIRNVCPGFLFRTAGGTGTMLSLEVCTMNLGFSYKKDAYPDSVIVSQSRFAATPEVIQSTQFENSSDLSLLIDKMNANGSDTTMLKTPAGICTELILPIDEIYKGHETDSITRAALTLFRINNQDLDAKDDDYALGIPQNILLVRKQNLKSFFDNHQVSDSQQSFTTTFQPTYNCYTFNNLGPLISYCHHEKEKSMRELNLTEEEWNTQHPDWNHVLLVPVTVATATNSSGTVSQISVNQDMSLCSTKLVRGTAASPIKMQVTYTRFAGK